MNKYELALVVSANVEDEVRTATIEKVNELILVSVVLLQIQAQARRRSLHTISSI